VLGTKKWRKLVGRAVASLQYLLEQAQDLLEQAQDRCEKLEKENGELKEAILDLMTQINHNKQQVETN
jgi:predicted  nucleic acid-binding Zn-ribbon protein